LSTQYELVYQVIKDFGFPVFIVAWFMLRTEKIIEKNTEALLKVAEKLGSLSSPKD